MGQGLPVPTPLAKGLRADSTSRGAALVYLGQAVDLDQPSNQDKKLTPWKCATTADYYIVLQRYDHNDRSGIAWACRLNTIGLG